jgi:hypothetical protein
MMHARLNRFIDMEPQAIQTALGWLQSDGFGQVLASPGFMTMFFGVDLATGRGVGITFWDSEAAMRISERVERPVRDEALRLARADRSKGLSDVYQVALVETQPVGSQPMLGRLARWEGVRSDAMRDAYAYFTEHELPHLRSIPGYAGIVLGANLHLGNTVGVTMWAGSDMEVVARAEAAATSRLEGFVGDALRPIFVDTYNVVAVPQLPQQLLQV